jgi:hypothetical protein
LVARRRRKHAAPVAQAHRAHHDRRNGE